MENTRKINKKIMIHLFPIPGLVLYSLFVVYPIIAAFTYSLFDWNGLVMGPFNYFANFTKLFTQEPYNEMFWNALGHNVIWFITEMIVQNGIALVLAYIIFKKLKGSGFFKIAYFLPRLMSVIVVGFLWKLILNPNTGVLNFILNNIGLESQARAWLGDPDTALLSVVLVNCWFAIGFYMLLFLAGLQSIPTEVLEAAELDGSAGFGKLFRIILPMMFQPLIIIIVMTFIQAFEAFELVYAMQGSSGEPYYSTDLLAVFFYRTAFGGNGGDGGQIGIGSALAVVMFAIISIISVIFMSYVNRKSSDL